MSKKKSYNPFKMWGAWVGGLIGVIFFWTGAVGEVCGESCVEIFGSQFLGSIWRLISFPLMIIPGPLPLAIGVVIIALWFVLMGFLVGWVIHSIIRKAR